MALEARHVEPRPPLRVDRVGVEGLLRELREYLDAAQVRDALGSLVLADSRHLGDDALPLRPLDNTWKRWRRVPEPLEGQLSKVLQLPEGRRQLGEVIVVDVQRLELFAPADLRWDLGQLVVAQAQASKIGHIPDGLRQGLEQVLAQGEGLEVGQLADLCRDLPKPVLVGQEVLQRSHGGDVGQELLQRILAQVQDLDMREGAVDLRGDRCNLVVFQVEQLEVLLCRGALQGTEAERPQLHA
mmetsp:Transcript_95116/g.245745  ORF Transcript_95116/g.245745 Transcript_95116/m.245745 type:complete len:242 (+) Transcript_95116:2605-3330(+)